MQRDSISSPISTNGSLERSPAAASASLIGRDQSDEFLRHFGFRESPFGVTPNPAFLFSSRMHLAALQSMVQSIESNLGFTVLLGDPGMGKTTLLLQLLTQYRDSARTAFIFQTQCKRYELLRYLASELELPFMRHDEVSLHQRLKEMLVNEARAGRKVLIFIDEAQNLQQSSLEAVRLLSDFETTRAKLLHIILSGSARLGEMLVGPDLSQLAQRISTVCRLQPLNAEEVSGYVVFRLKIAGCRVAGNLFSSEALSDVAEQSEGVPRIINSICYRALSLAHGIGERNISSTLVRQAARDLDLSSSGAANWSNVGHFLPTPKRPQASALRDLVSCDEKHAPAGPESSTPEVLPTAPRAEQLEEVATQEEIQFRSAAIRAVDNIPQPPFLAPQEKVIPEVPPPNVQSEPHAAAPKRHSGDNVRFPGVVRIRPWRWHRNLKKNRSTLVAVTLILLALGIWAVWNALSVKSRDAGQATAGAATAGSAQNQDLTAAVSDMLYSPTVGGELGREIKPIGRNKTPVIETLPQSLVPSKLRPEQSDGQSEAAPPAAAPNFSTTPNNLALPVVTDPKALTVRTETAPPANEAAVQNASPTRQPVRVVQPKYPKLAEMRHIEGDVLLELQVDSKGKVQRVRTVSGNPLLREAAEEAARQWEYPPVTGNQAPNSSVTRVIFNFKLRSETRK